MANEKDEFARGLVIVGAIAISLTVGYLFAWSLGTLIEYEFGPGAKDGIAGVVLILAFVIGMRLSLSFVLWALGRQS